MSDFWNLSDGEDIKETAGSGEFDAGGGNLLPIPSETSVLAAIDEAKWDKDQDGNRFISLRWTVLAPDDYKNRKVFQKLWVTDADPKAKADKVAGKRDKAKKMLGAIDTNCGGKLLAKGVAPTDESLTSCLTNKPMVVKVMIWRCVTAPLATWHAATGSALWPPRARRRAALKRSPRRRPPLSVTSLPAVAAWAVAAAAAGAWTTKSRSDQHRRGRPRPLFDPLGLST